MKNFSSSQLNGIYKMCRLELLQFGKRNLKNIYLLFFFNVLGTKRRVIMWQTQYNFFHNYNK